jgi:hypothetical protein
VWLQLTVDELLVRYTYDKDMVRFALVVTFIPAVLLASFPAISLVANIFLIFGPISQYTANSKFYSGVAPSRANITRLLPITVQMPVYKVS